jgi:hypothetical protein
MTALTSIPSVAGSTENKWVKKTVQGRKKNRTKLRKENNNFIHKFIVFKAGALLN